ncbi:nitrate reductase associated protein [Synechococcus sp. NOUM97013]|uniref:nitrate reductase associated protein n=1 Tax=Synechococcus sp. NOUM97013 TaxID=1442555 RepID=UPI0016455253|nr:nitrate reductase associated protein [Synechococcus sp. NOUM97013]
MHSQLDQARHCFAFEQDFVGSWRCIPLCVRRKLDLAGVKLKLSHWLAMTQAQRQQLVDWGDSREHLQQMREHLQLSTVTMADGVVKDLPPAVDEPWQQPDRLPDQLLDAARSRGVQLTPQAWQGMRELDRFALCKLARSGHDHHNLEAAFSEVLG